MARKLFVPSILVSALAVAAVLGWHQMEGNPMPDLVTQAAADTASLAPLTEAQITEPLRARLAKAREALPKAETPQQRAALLRELDLTARALAMPGATLKQATEDRALLAELQEAYGLSAPEGAEAAQAALEAGNIADAAPAFAALREQAEADIRRAAKAAYGLGRIAMAQGDTGTALGFFRRAADLDTRHAYAKAAQAVAIQLGQKDIALQLSKVVLQSALAEYGEVSAERAEALGQVAQAFLIAQKPADAEKLLREAIAVGEKATGGKDEAQAKRLNNLAAVLRAAGYAEAAEPIYRQAIEIDRAAPDGVYPETATRLSNLAELLVATGRAAEAEPLYDSAIKATRQAFGPTHPDLAMRIAALADLRRSLGKNEEALPLYLEAIEVSRVALGTEHPEFRSRLDRIASALRSIGKDSEAERLYRELLTLTESAVGKADADYGRALNNLAQLLASGDRKAEAEAMFREALSVLEKALGAQSADAKQVAANLGGLLAKQP
ncbi:tetratricopeptide repeat protein [Pseudorhodobacter sp. E13]|uniref:tetratricopeptide repeat protein n=1 Tax=Pseudorhodobacter sp. E13 TaxID=2487931 RepID=UPI0013159909|nr:tetratricopeptide repeat protein [Pseudorhodobacter sp. E13]